MIENYVNLCELNIRATRENENGIKLVPDVFNLREDVEKELERRRTLKKLLAFWVE